MAFIGVGSQLLDPQVEVPDYAADLVEAELARIDEAGGLRPSPLFPGLENGEDYSQYIPRGHYTLSEELERYFRSMMWYGRMTFRLKTLDPEVGRAETRSGLLLVQALRNAQVDGRPALEAWMDLYSPTVFFVGHSDDLLASQYMEVMDAVYGPGVSGVEGIFSHAAPWLRAADLTLGNFEGAIPVEGIRVLDHGSITSEEIGSITSEEIGSSGIRRDIGTGNIDPEYAPFELLIPPEASETLRAAGFDLLSLANNHTLDAGIPGLLETISRLKACGIVPLGVGPEPIIHNADGLR
ncbi:unnamed protein product, partial [marine sediment metagenome]